MAAQTAGEEEKIVAETLERIRARLSEQIKSDFVAARPPFPSNSEEPVGVSRLRVLLEAARFQGQVGAVNPRPGGLFNGVIQLFKRALSRGLRWYSRPIVQHQEATLQLLGEVIATLERDRSRLETLEGAVQSLPSEIADMRHQTLTKLEWLADELAKREKERL
jgi:hypothetical protein